MAVITGGGAVKSGSPMLMWITGRPDACSAAARLTSSMTWKGSMRAVRAARGKGRAVLIEVGRSGFLPALRSNQASTMRSARLQLMGEVKWMVPPRRNIIGGGSIGPASQDVGTEADMTAVKGTHFRELVETERPLVLPGAHAALSAMLIRQAGFKASFIVG